MIPALMLQRSRKPPTCKLQVQFIRSNGFAVFVRQHLLLTRVQWARVFLVIKLEDVVGIFLFEFEPNLFGHFCGFESEGKFGGSCR